MNDRIWDGEMDCGWEDLSLKVKTVSETFTDNMLQLASISPIEETRKLISEESMGRFYLLSERLADEITNGFYYQAEDDEESAMNPMKLTSWILLGSLTETSLQVFLAFYYTDYQKEKWQQWIEFPIDEVKNAVSETINELIQAGTITSKQGKSIKNAINDEIKMHTTEHPVQRIMLDEIIQFYQTKNLLHEDDISCLKTIQSNRNGVHSFEDRTIGNWFDLQYSVRFWCALLMWMLENMPSKPDMCDGYD